MIRVGVGSAGPTVADWASEHVFMNPVSPPKLPLPPSVVAHVRRIQAKYQRIDIMVGQFSFWSFKRSHCGQRMYQVDEALVAHHIACGVCGHTEMENCNCKPASLPGL